MLIQIAYSILSHVVAPKSVGGLEAAVLLFDMDHKINLGNVARSVSSLLQAIESAEERSKALYAAVERITVCRPTDIFHFSLLVQSLRYDPNRRNVVLC